MSIASVDRPSGSSVKPLDLVFLFSNVAGILLYLWLASHGWRIPQEHGAIPVTGEPLVWALALPVLGAFLLADIVWGWLALALPAAEARAMVAHGWCPLATDKPQNL